MAEVLSHQQERWHVKRIVLLTWWLIYFLAIVIVTRWGPGFTTNGLRALGQGVFLMALFIFLLRLVPALLWRSKRVEGGIERGQSNQLSLHWSIRWLVLILLSLGFLAPTIGAMMSVFIMRNPLPLIVPPVLILLKSPVIDYLFPAVSR